MEPKTSRRGFTFVELCFGLVVTSMVMMALGAFSLAMANAWKSAQKTQSITLAGNMTIKRLEDEIRNARLLGAVRAGSSDGSATGAAIMIWKNDTNGDGFIQGNECEMIEHDTTNHTLVRYPTGFADAAGTWSYSTKFTSSTVFTQFKVNRTAQVFAHNIYGAVFQTSGTSGTTFCPNLKVALKVMVDDRASSGSAVGGSGQLMVQYGSATVRAPIAQPNN
ncbi:MAG TPA: hypothetical protein VHD56_06115 [Tepidisphaeraceae bacterium]|nr:hypothetical protein [Tepidisphaeraceae bacterium]